ncbi:hypothetical protein [Enterococcus sp. LJL90]
MKNLKKGIVGFVIVIIFLLLFSFAMSKETRGTILFFGGIVLIVLLASLLTVLALKSLFKDLNQK